MNSVAEREDTIVQEVSIKGAAERIFAALIDPAELMEWWRAGEKFQITHAENDLRVGGKWSMTVEGHCGPDGRSTVTGVYQEIDPPHTLVFTWSRPEENEPVSTVRWDLKEENGVTTVRVTHSGLVSEEWRARNSGWPIVVGLLRDYVEGNS